MKIAVFSDSSEQSATINESSFVNLYDKSDNHYAITESIPVVIPIPQSLASMRSFLQDLIDRLADCRIIVASKLLGASYNVFDRAGFHIWEFTGHPRDFLGIIEQTEIIKKYDLGESQNPFRHFEDHGEGIYSIDIKQILFEDQHLTSKKLLLPFLDHKAFNELHVTFSHLPPWLESGLKKRGLIKKPTAHEIDEHQIIIKKITDEE